MCKNKPTQDKGYNSKIVVGRIEIISSWYVIYVKNQVRKPTGPTKRKGD